MPSLGLSPSRCLRISSEHQMPSLLHQGGQRTEFTGRRIHDGLVPQTTISLPSDSSATQNDSQIKARQIRRNPDRSLVDASTMVSQSQKHCSGPLQTFQQERPTVPTSRSSPQHRLTKPTVDCLENFPSIDNTLIAALRPFTRRLYFHKWNIFLHFTTQHNLSFYLTTLQAILAFSIIYSNPVSPYLL